MVLLVIGRMLMLYSSFVIRNTSQWCRSSVALPSDVPMAAYAVSRTYSRLNADPNLTTHVV